MNESMGLLNKNEKIKKRITIIIPIVIVVIVLISIFGIYKYIDISKNGPLRDINNMIEKKESKYIYIINNKDKEELTKEIKNYLDKKKLDYIVLNLSKYSNKEINKLKKDRILDDDNLKCPSIIYFYKGGKITSLSGMVDKSNVDTFISTIKLNIKD